MDGEGDAEGSDGFGVDMLVDPVVDLYGVGVSELNCKLVLRVVWIAYPEADE